MRVIKVGLLGFLAAASGILGGSCSGTGNEPDVSEETSVQLVFDARESDSRAAVTTESFNAPGSRMKVWGVYYKPSESVCTDLFNGTVVIREADNWTYSPIKYWFTGYTYDFRAIYPANPGDDAPISYIRGNGAASYLKIDNFTADGVDLMAASERRAIADTDKTPRPAVDLRFRHLLSRVTFVAANDDVEEYKILKFSISGIVKTGNWSGESYTPDGTSCGEWTPGNEGTYEAAIPSGGVSVGKDFVRLFDGDNLILAIPQTFESLVVDMEYAFAGTPDKIHTAKATLSGAWQSGKSYSYSFTVYPQLEFGAPAVDDWSSESVNNPDFDIKLP